MFILDTNQTNEELNMTDMTVESKLLDLVDKIESLLVQATPVVSEAVIEVTRWDGIVNIVTGFLLLLFGGWIY